MISNQEEDEFVAVRVQDPRLQNEGSWNSYVDYKIFLHTNSKAFTAKTSCVRRRYSEFAWLKKKLQKNAGLVPVPDLPGKSFFSFSNEDFLEKRRKGLQAFLDSVVNMTVCLSDSQLHLFLQTQLPVGHIEDCVQGHTPYSVTDAILTYASSNRGLAQAQAQEEDSVKEPSLTVSYESMESPAPHLPCIQPRDTFSPELLSAADPDLDPDLDPDPDPLEGLLELCDKDQHKEKSSIRVLQKNNHLEAVVEDQGPAEATFFLGDAPEADGSQQRSCRIQAAVEVHSPMGSGLEEKSGVDRLFQECSEREESDLRLGTENKTDQAAPHPDTEQEAARETVDSEAERCANSAAILDLKDSSKIKTDPHSDTVETADQVDVTIESSVSFPESLVLKESNFKEQVQESKEVLEEDVENHVIPEVHGLEQDSEEKTDTEEMVDESEDVQIEKVDLEPEKLENSAKVSHLEDGEVKEQVTGTNSDSQEEVLEVVCSENHVISEVNGLEHGAEEKDVGCQEEIRSDEEERKEPETLSVHSGEEAVKQDKDQDQDLVRTKDDSDDDSGSSSNESIVKVSDEEEEEEEEEEASLDANGYMKTEDAAARWSHVEASSRNILDLVPPVDREDDDLQLITHISDLSDSLDLNSAVTAGDLTENSDISILDM